jgi:HEAT repeat protein
MHDNLTIIIVVIVVSIILLLIAALLFASVLRRVRNARTYQKLDILRLEYQHRVQQAIHTGGMDILKEVLYTRPGSLAWRAVEDVLLGLQTDPIRSAELKLLFLHLGYVAYYEKRLTGRNVLSRASAIDKLGRMGAEQSVPKLCALLDDRNLEILSVTVRALSRIGLKAGLLAIVERLPNLLGRSQVTRKAMETALLNFGQQAVACLVECHSHDTDPWIMSCVLETLSYLPPDTRSANLALEHLGSSHAEVRSKALKVLGRTGTTGTLCPPGQVLPLLEDPVWFVRLQAVKTAREIVGEAAARPIGKLLFDSNWRVRSEAALALTRLGDCAVDVFLDALMTKDTYAKESICEEIEKTHCMDRLIEALGADDEAMRKKSWEILRIMHSLRFSTPLTEFLVGAGSERIKGEVRRLLQTEAAR